MAIEKVVYTPKPASVVDHPKSMVILVDREMLEKYKVDKSVALASVVGGNDIQTFDKPGTEGIMVKPSQSELDSAFGTTNETEIMQFMLEHGSMQPTGTERSKNDPHLKQFQGTN